MDDKKLSQYIQNIATVELALHADIQAFPRVLIDHTQHPEHLGVPGSILNKIISPNMAFMLRHEPNTGSIIAP